MINNKRASLLRILTVDHLAFYSALLFVFFWLFCAYDVLIKGEETTQNLMTTLAVATVVLAGVLVWRILSITSLFREGKESTGVINRVYFYRGRGIITYVHEYMGKKYICRDRVMKTKATTALTSGDEVTILFNTNNPKRAIIQDLYT